MNKPSTIRNLGPASDISFAKASILTANEIQEIGADQAYFRVLKSGQKPHFLAYCALVLGLQDRPWHSIEEEEKSLLRSKFEAIKEEASDKPSLGMIESELDKFGIR